MPGYNPTATPANTRTTLTVTTGSGPLDIGGLVISGSCPPVTETTNTQNAVRSGYWLKALPDSGKPLVIQQVNANGNLDASGNSLLITSPAWEGRTLLLEGGYEHIEELGLTLEPGTPQIVFTQDASDIEATGFEGGGKYGPFLARNGNETAIAYSLQDPTNAKKNARLSIIQNGQVITDLALAETPGAEYSYNIIPQQDGSYLVPVTYFAGGGTGTSIDLYRISPPPARTVTSVWHILAPTGWETRDTPRITEFPDGKKLIIWVGTETAEDEVQSVYGTVLNADYSTAVSTRVLGPQSLTGHYAIESISSDKFVYTYVNSAGKLRLGIHNLDSTFSLTSPEIDVQTTILEQNNPTISIHPTTGKIYLTFSEYVDTYRTVIYTAEFSLNESGALVAGPIRLIDNQQSPNPNVLAGSDRPNTQWLNDSELLIGYDRYLASNDANAYIRRLNVVTGEVSEEQIANPVNAVGIGSAPTGTGMQAAPILSTDGNGKGIVLIQQGGGGQNTDLRFREFEDGHMSDPIRVVDTPGTSVTIKDGTWVFLAPTAITLQLSGEQQRNVYLDGSQQYSLLLTAGTSAKRDVHAKREGETPKLILSGLNANTTITLAPDLSGVLQFAPMGNGTVLSIGGVNYAEFPNTPIATVQQALGVAPTTPPTPPAPTPEEPTPAPVPTPQPPVEEPSSPPELPPSPPVEEPVSPPPTEVPVSPTTPPVTPPPAPSAQPPSGEVTPPPQTSGSGRPQPSSIFILPFMLLDTGRDLLQRARQKLLSPANTNAEPKPTSQPQFSSQPLKSSIAFQADLSPEESHQSYDAAMLQLASERGISPQSAQKILEEHGFSVSRSIENGVASQPKLVLNAQAEEAVARAKYVESRSAEEVARVNPGFDPASVLMLANFGLALYRKYTTVDPEEQEIARQKATIVDSADARAMITGLSDAIQECKQGIIKDVLCNKAVQKADPVNYEYVAEMQLERLGLEQDYLAKLEKRLDAGKPVTLYKLRTVVDALHEIDAFVKEYIAEQSTPKTFAEREDARRAEQAQKVSGLAQ